MHYLLNDGYTTGGTPAGCAKVDIKVSKQCPTSCQFDSDCTCGSATVCAAGNKCALTCIPDNSSLNCTKTSECCVGMTCKATGAGYSKCTF